MRSSPKASSLRQRIGRARDQIVGLLRSMLEGQAFLRGTVYELKTRCGKPSCACAGEKRHTRWVLSDSHEGRKRMRVVPLDQLAHWRRWAANYREFRSKRAAVASLTAQLLEDLDALEREQRRSPEG